MLKGIFQLKGKEVHQQDDKIRKNKLIGKVTVLTSTEYCIILMEVGKSILIPVENVKDKILCKAINKIYECNTIEIDVNWYTNNKSWRG